MDSKIPINNEQIIKKLKEERENDKQVIHEYRKKINVFENLEKEYQEEIERLKCDNINITKKFEIKIGQFEKERNHLRNDGEVQSLQQKLEKMQIEIVQLKNELETNKKVQEMQILDVAPREDVEKLKENVVELEKLIEDLNVELVVCRKKCNELEENKQNIKDENLNLLESLDLKKEELKKANELIQDLQDDNMILKTELDALRNKPLDEQTRGNSLFAEVNDSRVELLKKMKTMSVQYNSMVKDRKSLLEEIDTLMSEKDKLLKMFKNDEREYQPGNQTEILYYKTTIDGLQRLNKSYVEEIGKLRSTENGPISKDLKYFESSLENKKKEIDSVREDFRLHLSNYTNYARNINSLEKEMVKWKWAHAESENQIRTLELKIKKLEGENEMENLDKIDENPKMIKRESSVTHEFDKRNSNSFVETETEPEKGSKSRTVRFAEHI